MNKIIPVVIILLLAGAFYGGMKYAQGKTSQLPVNFQQRFQQAGANLGFITGDIISKDDQSITVKLRDGGSKLVFYSDGTEISKSASGSPDDLEVGKSVTINGEANQDGSVVARSIQLRPEMPKPQK